MMYSQIDTIEVMINNETDNFIAEIFNHYKIDIKITWRN